MTVPRDALIILPARGYNETLMPHWGKLFLLYVLSTAGLITSVFLLGDMTLFYEGMSIIGVILITNLIVVALRMHQ